MTFDSIWFVHDLYRSKFDTISFVFFSFKFDFIYFLGYFFIFLLWRVIGPGIGNSGVAHIIFFLPWSWCAPLAPQALELPRVDVLLMPVEEAKADVWSSPWLSYQLNMESGYSKETSEREVRHLQAAYWNKWISLDLCLIPSARPRQQTAGEGDALLPKWAWLGGSIWSLTSRAHALTLSVATEKSGKKKHTHKNTTKKSKNSNNDSNKTFVS